MPLVFAPAQARAQSHERTVQLAGGPSLVLSGDWAERRVATIPPPALLQPSAPDFRYTDFVALEKPAGPAAVRFGVSSNAFVGLDPRALDTRLNSPQALALHLFFFFFPPPSACLAVAEADLRSEYARAVARQLKEIKQAKEDGRPSRSASPPSVSVTQRCAFSASLADFFAAQLSAGVAVHGRGSPERANGLLSRFRVPPMEQVEVNGMTFFIFEAEGQRFIEQDEVDKFRLTQQMRGTKAHFFWAIGAPSPFPFADDSNRREVPLIHLAYATLSLSGDARGEFLALLRAVGPPAP